MYGKFIDSATDFAGKYVIFEPTSGKPPTVVYDNKNDAIKTSYILAGRNPGKSFVVLKVAGITTTKTPVFEEL